MKPLIAITAGEIHNQIEPWSPVTYGQSYTYVDAIVHAGGTPIIVPFTDDMQVLRQLYELVGGILFAGGEDPDPALYGETPLPHMGTVSKRRDKLELQLLGWALADQKPLLGICRGMQLLNIHLGGTLYQDIPVQLPDASDHNSSTKRKSLVDIAHTLRVDEHSQLAKVLRSTTVGANTHHHQAIKTLGQGLVANAWSEDGLIEGIELPGARLAIGVQSHPESLEATAEPLWRHFFKALVQASTL
jgi:putative glutamine amidotransferase